MKEESQRVKRLSTSSASSVLGNNLSAVNKSASQLFTREAIISNIITTSGEASEPAADSFGAAEMDSFQQLLADLTTQLIDVKYRYDDMCIGPKRNHL
jgi:hypothetical protein